VAILVALFPVGTAGAAGASSGRAPAGAALSEAQPPQVTTAFPRSLWLGASVTLRGSVAPAHPGAAVTIERRVEDVWQPLATATLDERSRFAVDWRPDEFGFFRLRARIAAGEGHEEGVSASERVTVNRPNRHDVPYRFAHYIVIVVHRYRLYYYERGALVRAFDVALGRPGYRTPLGHFRIWAKRRPARGALGACAMYYRGSIAIHGTNQPHLLTRFPRAFSHGCARMYNREALWLYRRCPRGTPVHNLR
jgi:lipoprotein-anchoring transpeptidase ErfK/SrfK